MFFRQTAPFPDTVQDMLLELRNFGLVHLRDALKRILYAQFVIFFLAHRVIGEDIERFEVLEFRR